MPGFRLNVSVKQKGMVLDASASTAAGLRAVADVNTALAEEALQRVQRLLATSLMHPTGYYQSRVVLLTGQRYRGVWDSNVVYGGWLEGTTARNTRSRFKGYGAFSKVRQSMQQDKVAIAAPIISALIKEL